MENLIRGSIPTDASSIRQWSSINAVSTPDPMYGFIYKINPDGMMAQFAYKDVTISQVEVNIIFKNTTKKIQYADFVMTAKYEQDNGPSSSIALAFPPSEDWQTLAFPTDIGGLAITQYAFEVRNEAASGSLQFAQIVLSGEIKTGGGTTVDTEEFVNCAILYGTDANKPKLR